MTANEEFDIDEQLDDAFSSDNDEDIINEGDEDDTSEDSVESEETLESLMETESGKTSKKNDKTDSTITTNKQTNQQSTNQQRGSNNGQDLVDKDGNVIAKAGAERRFYEENVRLKQERDNFNRNVMPKLRENYNMMAQKVEAYDQALQSMRANDLTPSEIQTGLELIRNWKKSPEDTMRFLLTQAKSYGMNIDSSDSAINMNAISQMIDDKLKPFTDEREVQAREYRAREEATQTYNDFMSRFPDAKIHGKELAYVMKTHPEMSLTEAYYSLRTHFAENNYDFGTPLEEILKQRDAKTSERASFNMRNTNQTVKSAQIKQPIASVNMSYNDIIREAMKSVKK